MPANNFRHRLRLLGNALLPLFPRGPRRMLLKGLAERPELAEACGFQVLPQNYYSPVAVLPEIARGRLTEARALPGVDLRREAALGLLRELVRESAAELQAVPRARPAEGAFWLENNAYADLDAATLYAMLRHLRPARYVEIGCGFSTRASTAALARNAADGGRCEAHFVEPYPDANLLDQTLPGPLLRQRVQELPPELLGGLREGDVLFIDTSHVLRTQNDVEHELLRVLPALAPGVWVHIHDIFSPYDYPEEWLFGAPRISWNEQYAVECLLSGGGRFQVELPVYALWREHRAELDALRPGTSMRPAAFWLRRTSAP